MPTEDVKIYVEVNGERVSASVLGNKIIANLKSAEKKSNSSWYWWVVLPVGVIGVGYWFARRRA